MYRLSRYSFMEKEGNNIIYLRGSRQANQNSPLKKKKSLVNETQMLGGKPRMSDSKSMLFLPYHFAFRGNI